MKTIQKSASEEAPGFSTEARRTDSNVSAASTPNPPPPEAFYKHRNIDCGNCPVGNFCCTLKVRLSLLDRLRILLRKGLRTRQYADRLFDGSGWGIRLVNGDCYFLKRLPDGKAFCTIYDARPSVCRKFPHFFEDINDCRDIVRKWKRRIVKGVDVTEVELGSR